MPTVVYVVRGRVQGVGFRYFVRSAARALGVLGWVRNAADGSVEIRATAPAAILAQLESHLAQGPPGAHVESVTGDSSQTSDVYTDGFVVVR